MKNSYQNLEQVLRIAHEIAQFIKDHPDDDRLYSMFISLIFLEDSVDLGRMFLEESEIGKLPIVNDGLDRLRSEVSEIAKSLDQNILKTVLDSAGEKLKHSFAK